MRLPTLHDVAAAAGVSYATADRVLNERGGVAEKSKIKVLHAIEKLGYQRDIRAANLSRSRIYRFRFYLPDGDHGFFKVLRKAVQNETIARVTDRISISTHDVPFLDSEALADRLDQIDRNDCDCVAVVSANTLRMKASIARLSGLGIPVVTLIADTENSKRAAYIGINNLIAGQTAGRLMRIAHRQSHGYVLPILASMDAKDHVERLQGLQSVLAESEPEITLFDPIQTFDSLEKMTHLTQEAITNGQPISGIYSIGAANRALLNLLGTMPGPRPFVILHELTPHSRRGLEAGLVDAVIDQKPFEEVAAALEVMRALADGTAPPTVSISPTIFLKDNLPQIEA